jgi:cytidylate kinase
VAIDGPAASGKSTTARSVAERLGVCHLSSGLLYRTVAWCALRDGWIGEPDRWAERVAGLDLALDRAPPGFSVTVRGEGTGAELISGPVTGRVSEIAASPDVRTAILPVLRAAGVRGGLVCDGRDIGTVVFPGADLKVFLVASPRERAKRRLLERGEQPSGERLEAETRRLTARDRRDSERATAPLRRAPDAVELDTTDLSPGEVVERIVAMVRSRDPGEG